ncbi:NB-ARC domain-containing protein [Dactylosporangium sp. NPDC051541]|uniref:NB-ARC domain-containing protein n=1 Tax=Dactylosporangium sp. NPDC051541 TaxID=3363977 RepID=UPI0037A41DE5
MQSDVPIGKRQTDPRVVASGPASVAIGGNNEAPVTINQPPEISWPVCVGILPRRAASFQERVVSASTNTTVLCGLSGVGKTQLAAALATRAMAEGELDLLVWITVPSRAALLAGYANAAAAIALPTCEPEDAAAQFHGWLAGTSRRWMIVLDDVVAAGHLQGLWPPTHPTGRIVVTTQLQNAALTRPGGDSIVIPPFTHDEAGRYLHHCLAGDKQLADDVAGVARDLGGLPLALSQAAAFMIDEQVTCTEYRRRFAERRTPLEALVPEPESLPDDYSRTIPATMSLAIDAADRTRPHLARAVLAVAATLGTTIPAALFETTAVVDRITEAGDPALVRSALRSLHRLSLLSADTDSVAIHVLVQRAVRDELESEQFTAAVRTAADALEAIWPDVERDAEYSQVLRANATALFQVGREVLLQPAAHQVLLRTSQSYGDADMFSQAIDDLETLLAALQRSQAPDTDDTLTVRHEIAKWRGQAGDARGAAEAFAGIVDDRLRVSGPEHRKTLSARLEAALWLMYAGEPAASSDALRALVADCIRILGPDDRTTLIARSNFVRSIGAAGDPAAARDALADLLPDLTNALGPDHIDTLTGRHDLAMWRGEAGDPAAAAADLTKLVGELPDLLRPDHPHTLLARAQLARWRAETGDITALEERVAEAERVLGPHHPDTFAARGTLAFFQGQAGDVAGAAAAFGQLLVDMNAVMSPGNLNVLTTRLNHTRWCGEAGQPVQDDFRSLIVELRQTLGDEHPLTVKAQGYLARLQSR